MIRSRLLVGPTYALTAQRNRVASTGANATERALRDEAYYAQVEHWNQTGPGQLFEHERYNEGWNME